MPELERAKEIAGKNVAGLAPLAKHGGAEA